MKRLRESPIRSFRPKRLKSAQMRDGDDALFRRLAEADAGIEHDLLAPDAGLFGDGERALEKRHHVGDDVDRGVGLRRGYA